MAEGKTGLTLALLLQFLAAWLAVWLGRVLQEQVDFLRAENRLLREKLGTKRIQLTDVDHGRKKRVLTGSWEPFASQKELSAEEVRARGQRRVHPTVIR